MHWRFANSIEDIQAFQLRSPRILLCNICFCWLQLKPVRGVVTLKMLKYFLTRINNIGNRSKQQLIQFDKQCKETEMSKCCNLGMMKFIAGLATAVALVMAGVVMGFVLKENTGHQLSNGNIVATPASFVNDASRAKNVSIATGLLDDNIESIYVLDHLTGNLKCWFMSPRTGEVVAEFATNVTGDLGPADGDSDFAMCTGLFYFANARTGQQNYAQSVCYIADSNSGAVVGYTMLYNRTALSKGTVQRGELQSCLLYTSPSPRDRQRSRMPSSA